MDPEAVTRLNDLVELMTDKTYGAQGPILAKRRYVYASYVDEPVMMVSGVGTKHYFHQNHLYSVAAMTSSTGAVVERYRYDAYGKRTVTNAAGTPIAASTIGQQRGFTGYYLDAETGLYYARARMYSAGLGRFISRDPMGYVDGPCLYAAHFAPNHLDSSGTQSTNSCCSGKCGRMGEYSFSVTDAGGNVVTQSAPLTEEMLIWVNSQVPQCADLSNCVCTTWNTETISKTNTFIGYVCTIDVQNGGSPTNCYYTTLTATVTMVLETGECMERE